MNAKKIIVAIVLFALMVLSACAPQPPAELTAGQAQSTANAAVLTAMANVPTQQPAATQKATPTVLPTTTPSAPKSSGDDYQGTDQCQDGKIISNQFADISRIPIGTLEGAIVAEVSWTGSGFGGFDRAVVVIPRMTSQTMAFVRNSKTIHLVQYCGFLKDILAYAPTHVDAMVQSAQDDAGNRPDPDEIGVYFLNLDGSWTVVREGPKGPGLAFLQQRVVMTP